MLTVVRGVLWTVPLILGAVAFGCGDSDPVEVPTDPPLENAIVFFGGSVITMDPVGRVDEAVLVQDDRVLETGSRAAMLARAGARAVRVDLAGHTVMPGFVDPHNHVYNAVFLGQSEDRVGTSYEEAQSRLIAAGTTTLAKGNIWPDAFSHFREWVDGGGLRARTSVYLGYNSFCGDPWPAGWYLAHPPITDPNALFRIPGVKFFTDGGACNRGAFTFFADGGDLYFTATELATALEAVEQRGYQALIHALGDIAVDTALAAIETLLQGAPNTRRHRMDHNRYLRSHQFPRYSEVGVIPVVFGSPFTCPIEDGGDWSFLAREPYTSLRPRLDPWRALIDANPGLPVAWKSDAPGHWPLEPFVHLWSLVTRDELRPDGSVCEAPDWLEAGAVTVQEALRMMTVNAAYALHMDGVVGSLSPGKFADLIVVSENPLTTPSESLRSIEVRMTMIGGKVEFCRAGYEELCPGG